MQRRMTLLLSVLVLLAFAATAPAGSKPVERKKSTVTKKEVSRVKETQRAKPPAAPRYTTREEAKEWEQRPPRPDYYQRAPEPKPQPGSLSGDPRAKGKDRRESWRKNDPSPQPFPAQRGWDKPADARRPEGPRDVKRWDRERPPSPQELRADPRVKEVTKRPVPSFLANRSTEELKQPLPKETIRGTIESIQGEKAIVRTRDGKRATVQLGPQSYMRQKGITLREGQDVTVDGWGEWSDGGGRAESSGFFFAGGIYGPGYHFEFANDYGYPYWADPEDYWDGWYPSWDVYYVYFWGPPPWWAYAPPPYWYYYGPPPRWWYHRHYYAPPPWYAHCRW